jgi:N-methylhydantoinase A
MADVVYDAAHAFLHPAGALVADPSPLHPLLAALKEQVRGAFGAAEAGQVAFTARLDLRYTGQSYELDVPLALPPTPAHLEAACDAFHRAHEQRYGHALPGTPVEAVAVRLRGALGGSRPPLPEEPPAETGADAARIGTRDAWFTAEAPTPTACYDRAHLHHGHRFDGPAVVYQYDTTLVVPPAWQARVDAGLNLWLQQREG